MCKLIVLALALCSVLFGSTNCASSYDQRQTGDLNVQIGLKNIQLIALLKGGTEEYVDYDYAYDYSEMTIKPQHGTTLKPINATNTQTQSDVTNAPLILAVNTTEPNVIVSEIVMNTSSTEPSNNTTGYVPSVTVSPVTVDNNQSSDTLEDAHYSTIITTRKAVIADEPTTVLPNIPVSSSASPALSGDCRRGFVQNNQGKCEYKVHGTSNALRRIVKLAQKIKIGRGVKET